MTISGSPDLSEAVLYGSASTAPATVSDLTVEDKNKVGNVLNVSTTASSTAVQGIYNFQTMNLDLPSTIQNNDVYLFNSTAIDLSDVAVNVGLAGDKPALNDGDMVYLFSTVTNSDKGTYNIMDSLKNAFSDKRLSVEPFEDSVVLKILPDGTVIKTTVNYAYGNDPELKRTDKDVNEDPAITGAVKNNKLTIAVNGVVNKIAYGGATTSGDATDNQLFVTGGKVGDCGKMNP